MLPPGAGDPAPVATTKVDGMLPPGIGAGPSPGQQVALPESPDERDLGGLPILEQAESGSLTMLTEDGSSVTLREPVKTIGHGDDAQELRQLTSKEKARRRMVKNLVLWSFGALILIVAVLILRWLGPLS